MTRPTVVFIPKNCKYTVGNPMPAHRFLERHLMALAIAELAKEGWKLAQFLTTGKEPVKVKTATDAWAKYDKFNGGTLTFTKKGQTKVGWIEAIGRSGVAVIQDYSNHVSFQKAMERVFLS